MLQGITERAPTLTDRRLQKITFRQNSGMGGNHFSLSTDLHFDFICRSKKGQCNLNWTLEFDREHVPWKTPVLLRYPPPMFVTVVSKTTTEPEVNVVGSDTYA